MMLTETNTYLSTVNVTFRLIYVISAYDDGPNRWLMIRCDRNIREAYRGHIRLVHPEICKHVSDSSISVSCSKIILSPTLLKITIKKRTCVPYVAKIPFQLQADRDLLLLLALTDISELSIHEDLNSVHISVCL